jgi:Uma2 family endonuclease
MTFAEFEQHPDPDFGRLELVNGEVIHMPPPERKHSDAALQIQRILTQHFGWDRVRPDRTGFLISDNSWLEPDVSVLWPGQAEPNGYFTGSPLIAVEVLSPEKRKIATKIELYLGAGATEVWVVDPEKRTLTVYVKPGDQIVSATPEGRFYCRAAGTTIELNEIFRRTLP